MKASFEDMGLLTEDEMQEITQDEELKKDTIEDTSAAAGGGAAGAGAGAGGASGAAASKI